MREERGYMGLQRARVALPVWPHRSPSGRISSIVPQGKQVSGDSMWPDSSGRLDGATGILQNGAGWWRANGLIAEMAAIDDCRVASVSQSEQLASTPEPPLPKEKKQNYLSKPTDLEMGESEG